MPGSKRSRPSTPSSVHRTKSSASLASTGSSHRARPRKKKRRKRYSDSEESDEDDDSDPDFRLWYPCLGFVWVCECVCVCVRGRKVYNENKQLRTVSDGIIIIVIVVNQPISFSKKWQQVWRILEYMYCVLHKFDISKDITGYRTAMAIKGLYFGVPNLSLPISECNTQL